MSTLLRREFRDIHGLLAGRVAIPIMRTVGEDHPLQKQAKAVASVVKPSPVKSTRPSKPFKLNNDGKDYEIHIGEF